VAGARDARGTVVVIDVLRAFSVSAYALAGGATECRLVREVADAMELAGLLPGSVVSAEVEGLPVPGIPISNSPTMVAETDMRGRTLVQRTSSGTQGMARAERAERLYAGSLVVAAATARAIRKSGGDLVTLVATGEDRGHPEDRACADLLEALLLGIRVDVPGLLAPLRASDRYRRMAAGLVAGLPASDLELCLDVDRFDFAMPVSRDRLGLRVTRERT
jgi:2-phosphosulfolactate phosphatase